MAVPHNADGNATGAEEVVRFLQERNIRHIFGLPGSSLVGLLSNLDRSEIRIVPAVHESVVIAAADGYARVAGQGAAYIYMVPGTANALANIYSAWRDETPMIVFASQQMSTARTSEGTIGEFDTVPIVRPFVRYARELTPGMPVHHYLETAMRSATGYPTGPVFISLPEDVLDGPTPVVAVPKTVRRPSGAPDVGELAAHLAKSERPLLVVGGQVRRYGGSEVLERLATKHGIALAYEPGFNDRMAVAPSHPCLIGSMTGPSGSVAENKADFAAVVGGRFIAEGHPRPNPFFPSAGFVAHVNADPAKLEETRVANWSCACDPAAFLRALEEALGDAPDAALLAKRQAFIKTCQGVPLPDIDFLRSLAAYGEGLRGVHDALDRGWVVDEAVMGSVALMAALSSDDGRRYIGSTGGSLGWGAGAAIGVAMASGEPVTCVLGDGALRFGMHALWTAVAERLPITYVILDNGGYGSTRYFSREYNAKAGDGHNVKPSYAGMDFRQSGSTVEGILRGLGVKCGDRVDPAGARKAIEEAWASCGDGPNAVVIQLPFGD